MPCFRFEVLAVPVDRIRTQLARHPMQTLPNNAAEGWPLASELSGCSGLLNAICLGLGIVGIATLSGRRAVRDLSATSGVRSQPSAVSRLLGCVPGGDPVEIVREFNIPLWVKVLIVLDRKSVV